MTPKEKAEELVLKYLRLQEEGSLNWFHKILAKQCALIAVDFAREFITGDLSESFDKTMYLFEIKQEIEKL
jgi:hypothetical protein